MFQGIFGILFLSDIEYLPYLPCVTILVYNLVPWVQNLSALHLPLHQVSHRNSEIIER